MLNRNTVTPVVCVVAARSGTGKTTLLEQVIAELTRRTYRVAIIKHIHQAELDLPGKDSWRYREAGALAAALVATSESVVFHADHIQDPFQLIPYLPAADIILMEGFRYLPVGNKIEVVRGAMGAEIVTPPQELAAVVTDLPVLKTAAPCFSLNDPVPLVDWLIARFIAPAQQSFQSESLTHFDAAGRARMVDVSAKEAGFREAVAAGEIWMKPETLALLRAGKVAKGDVLAVAQVAAIMAVKETARLIPMCHPLNISGTTVDFQINEPQSKVEITVTVRLTGQTGVEMEALTGVSVAALTIYDMCKAVDKGMEIGAIRLLRKSGGKSGDYLRENQ